MPPPAAARPFSVPGPAPLTSPAGPRRRQAPQHGGAEPEAAGWGGGPRHGPAAPTDRPAARLGWAGLGSAPLSRPARPSAALPGRAAPPRSSGGSVRPPRALVQPLPRGVRGGARPSARLPAGFVLGPAGGRGGGVRSRRLGGGGRLRLAPRQGAEGAGPGRPRGGCSVGEIFSKKTTETRSDSYRGLCEDPFLDPGETQSWPTSRRSNVLLSSDP